MSNDTHSDGLCTSCVDTSLVAAYPPWRLELAYICLAVHTFVFVLSICMLIMQYSRADLRGRDPVLMWLMIVGLSSCFIAPIRDLLSEGSTPCVAQVIFAAMAVIFLLNVNLVRLARVLALHRQQKRAAIALATRDSRSAVRLPSNSTLRVSSLSPSSTTVQETPILAPSSPICAAENERRFSFSDQMQSLSPKSTSLNTEISIPESETPVPEMREIDASWRLLLGWVLEKFKLHTSRGQLWFMAALAVPKLTGIIYRVSTLDAFRWDGYGCSDSFTDVQLLTAYVGVLAILQLGGLIILYRRPDAFYLREELIIVFLAMMLQLLLLFNHKSIAGEQHINMYFAMWTSWVYAAVVFVLPVCRRAPRLYEDGHSSGRTMCCNGGRVHPLLHSADTPITVNIHNTSTTNASTEGGECPLAQASCANPPANSGSTGMEMLGTLLRYYTDVFSTKTDDFIVPSMNEILWDVEQTLQRDVHLLSLQDLEKICLFLAYRKDGRKLLSDCLAREWCMELLLFCVDVAEFHRQIERMEITFERLSLQLSRLKSNHDPNQPSTNGTRIRNSSIVFGAPHKLYAGVLNAAKRIFRNYLSPDAITPVNLSPCQIQAATSSLASFEHTAASMQKLLLGGLANLPILVDAAVSFVSVELPAFSHTFDAMERQVVSDLATGPILRFTSSHAYATWKAAVIEEFRGTLQGNPASQGGGSGVHRKRSQGKDNTFSVMPSAKP